MISILNLEGLIAAETPEDVDKYFIDKMIVDKRKETAINCSSHNVKISVSPAIILDPTTELTYEIMPDNRYGEDELCIQKSQYKFNGQEYKSISIWGTQYFPHKNQYEVPLTPLTSAIIRDKIDVVVKLLNEGACFGFMQIYDGLDCYVKGPKSRYYEFNNGDTDIYANVIALGELKIAYMYNRPDIFLFLYDNLSLAAQNSHEKFVCEVFSVFPNSIRFLDILLNIVDFKQLSDKYLIDVICRAYLTFNSEIIDKTREFYVTHGLSIRVREVLKSPENYKIYIQTICKILTGGDYLYIKYHSDIPSNEERFDTKSLVTNMHDRVDIIQKIVDDGCPFNFSINNDINILDLCMITLSLNTMDFIKSLQIDFSDSINFNMDYKNFIGNTYNIY